MSNTLLRAGSTYTIPAVLYVPAHDAYVAVITRERREPIYGMVSSGVVYIDPITRIPNNIPVNAVIGYRSIPYYEFVTYPSTPETPGSPSVRIDSPPQGWNSYAHSGAYFWSQGEASFNVSDTVTGAVVGLASIITPTAGYGHIAHGLLFTGGKYYNKSGGSEYGTFDSTDQFTIRVRNGQATTYKNDVLIFTEASTFGAEQIYLSVTLYGARDSITSPELLGLYGGSASMRIPMSTMSGTQDAKASARMMIPRARIVSLLPANRARMAIPSPAMYGAQGVTHADGVLRIPRAALIAYGGTRLVELRSTADMVAPRAAMTGHMFTGTVASASMLIPAATIFAADRPYGAARLKIPPTWMIAYDEPAGEAMMFEVSTAINSLGAITEELVLMFDGVVGATTMTSNVVLDALAYSTGTVDDIWATSAILDAIISALANVGFLTAAVPSTSVDNDTWAVNLDSSGTTTYSNYGFNSFVTVGGKHYGANEAGLFELDGDTDDGVAIRSRVSFGKLDFGTATKKTVSQAYVGFSGAGNLFIKIIAEDNEEYIYSTRDFSAELQQQRVTFGKGLRTNYVWLELYNENGTDFELDTVEFRVADITRRI